MEHVRKTGARGPDFLGQKALPDHHHREPWQEQLRLLFGSRCPTLLCCFKFACNALMQKPSMLSFSTLRSFWMMVRRMRTVLTPWCVQGLL